MPLRNLRRSARGVFALGVVAGLVFGCSSGGSARRTVAIVATTEACSPARVEVKAGERIAFEVKNESSGDREFEGIEGTKIEETLVPAGRTRTIDYTVPESAQPLKVKCYVPGGPTTLIEIVVRGSVTEEGGGRPFKTTKSPNATVNVHLDSFVVKPDVASAPAGPIKFIATNDHGTHVHELAVLRIREDGSLQNTGEIEDIDPRKSGDVALDLPTGKYRLACLIVPGEAGSTVDHYQSGMHVDFEVR